MWSTTELIAVTIGGGLLSASLAYRWAVNKANRKLREYCRCHGVAHGDQLVREMLKDV